MAHQLFLTKWLNDTVKMSISKILMQLGVEERASFMTFEIHNRI